jgi:hypothetical protein
MNLLIEGKKMFFKKNEFMNSEMSTHVEANRPLHEK